MAELCLPPLSLYIHIPWCEKKCPYCDFNSHVSEQIPEQKYIDALLCDLDSELVHVQGRELRSIFIGGGTPSLFAPESIARLLRGIKQRLAMQDGIEITMEANPGSSEQKKFVALRQAGINRLSLGIQSFDDTSLQSLGRIHHADQARAAIRAASEAGFQRINLDLMFGLAGQTAAHAVSDLQQAIAGGASHISWYQLTIEPNTRFYRYPPQLPVEDTLADIQQQGQQVLEQAGFSQYEVSAWCKPGQPSQHNLNYWQFGDYLAIGAGAHGKISLPTENRIVRYSKTRGPVDYLARQQNYLAGSREVQPQERLLECLMNSLRLVDGMVVDECLARTGTSLEALESRCQPLVAQGLLNLDQRLYASESGFRYLDSVLERLL